MSLSDALKAAVEKQNQALGCKIALLLATLDKAEAEALQKYLDDPKIRHATISQALVSEGHEVSEDVISKHRRGLHRHDPQ